MVADKFGYLYFCDRTGDTYRWKGENVSTVEVENILMGILERNDVVVFGVSVPGRQKDLIEKNRKKLFQFLESDGKAGMAVIVDDPTAPIDLAALPREMKKHGLPIYARPCFIRLTKTIEMTGLFVLFDIY